MPIIRMYPPSGIALKPYSVSPTCLDQTVLPNPIMYWVVRTLNSLANDQVAELVPGDGEQQARAANSTMPITVHI